MSEERPRARLWFGAAGLLDGSVGWEGRGRLASVDLPVGDLTHDHSARLPWVLEQASPWRVLADDGVPSVDTAGATDAGNAGDAAGTHTGGTHTGDARSAHAPESVLPAGARVFDGFTVTEPLAGSVTGGGAAAPLFVTVTVPGAGDGRPARLRTFSRLLFSATDGLFLLTGDEPVREPVREPASAGPALAGPAHPGPALAELAHAAEAVRRHRALFLPLNNAIWTYDKHFAGTEIEYKLTLRPPVDPWRLAIDLYRRMSEGRFGPFRPEYGAEFESCEFRNHLYEVDGAPEERGYISFIPIDRGRHLVRRKWFTQDALARREEIDKDVELVGDYEEHIAATFKVPVIPHPPFTRIRYDLNVESMRTGHVYVVLFDRCEADGHPGAPLQQCEVEYVRSRSALGADPSSIDGELAALKRAVGTFLAAEGTPFEDGYLSKLTWLRSLTGRPGPDEDQ